jgi:hypothetical protein
VVDLVARVLLVLDAGHDDGKDGEEEEAAEVDPEHGIDLGPLMVWHLAEVVNPYTQWWSMKQIMGGPG